MEAQGSGVGGWETVGVFKALDWTGLWSTVAGEVVKSLDSEVTLFFWG